MSTRKESGEPSILDHTLARWDRLRESLIGGPAKYTATIIESNQTRKVTWPVELAIYRRGGERITLELPNGMRHRFNSNDVIHYVGANGQLMARFRARNPDSDFKVVEELEP